MNLTRREVLFATAATLVPFTVEPAEGSASSRLSVEGYIWQQYMASKGKKLGDGLEEVFGMARAAGFNNIELNTGFLTNELRDRVLELIQSNGLSMPSVYVGGAMHDEALADATIAHSIEIARLCKKVGCAAIVGDPSPKQGSVEKTDAELAVQAAMLNKLGKGACRGGISVLGSQSRCGNGEQREGVVEHLEPHGPEVCVDVHGPRLGASGRSRPDGIAACRGKARGVPAPSKFEAEIVARVAERR